MTVLVVALGHPDRGDDAVAGLVADRLHAGDEMVVRRLPGDPSRLLDDPWWTAADRVVLVDAVRTGAPPGTVHRWTAPELLRPGSASGGDGHGLGLVATLALAQALGRLPGDVVVVGVEGTAYDVGSPPAPAVVAGVDRAVATVRRAVASPPPTRSADAASGSLT